MTEEEITEQAEAYADKIDDGSHTARQCAILAFKKGFGTKFPNSKGVTGVWHPMEDYPKPSVPVVIVTKIRRRFKHAIFDTEKHWLGTAKSMSVWKWAYKEDLL